MNSKAVLVTGSSTGIGRECVLLLASRGYRVFAGVRKRQDADALSATNLRSLTPVLIDVTDPASISSAVQAVSAALEPDASFSLVNNAGIVVAGPLELLAVDSLRRQLEVNVIGQVAVTQAFLPLLRARKGRIVFMGSLFGRIAPPYVAPYAAAKFAMEAIADGLAVELWEWGIPVTILEPGNIATPIWEKSRNHVLDVYGGRSDDGTGLYKTAQDAILRMIGFFGSSGLTPAKVAQVVEKVLRVRRPRSRYLVGWDAKLLGRIAPASPARVRYWVMRRILGRR